MGRKVSDCRDHPGHCSLSIAGEEQEVLEVATRHLATEHDQDAEEVRAWLLENLQDA